LPFFLANVLIGGIFAYSRMQTSLFPKLLFPKIKNYCGCSLHRWTKMMVTVTRPLEMLFKQIPDLTTFAAHQPGQLRISAFIDWNGDVDLSQQRIEARIW